MNLSDDEKIVLGTFCETVLSSGAFNTITNQYEQSTVQQLLTTKPTDRGRRDELYFSIRGVRDLLSLMSSYVAEKDRLLLIDQPTEPSEDDVEDDED